MNKYKKIIGSVVVLLFGLCGILLILMMLMSDLKNSTIFDFLIFTILYPAMICFVAVSIVGIINESYRIAAIYSLIYGIIVSVLVNVIILVNIETEVIAELVANTPSSEAIIITTSEPGGFGDVLTSVLLFATVGAAGGMIGAKIRKFYNKKRRSFENS